MWGQWKGALTVLGAGQPLLSLLAFSGRFLSGALLQCRGNLTSHHSLLTGVWSRDDSSEVEAQSVWGVVVGVTASQLSSLGSGTS